jgi:hypothetical protein
LFVSLDGPRGFIAEANRDDLRANRCGHYTTSPSGLGFALRSAMTLSTSAGVRSR